MTVPRLDLPQRVYDAAWASRRTGETLNDVVVRVLTRHFCGPVVVPEKPILELVEVLDV